VADEAIAGSGCAHDVYVQKVSFAIEILLKDLPEDHRPRAMEIAREEFDYATRDELAEAQREMAEAGLCTHGLDPDCCPLGCGDLDY
jgi:hypothetical protein